MDTVIRVKSRRFFFRMLIAQELNVGFIPVRKPNKLSQEVISATDDLEYGTDTLEIHTDAIQKGDRILILDDALATGVTAKAICELLKCLDSEIVQCNFLRELTFLNGRSKMKGNEIFAAITSQIMHGR